MALGKYIPTPYRGKQHKDNNQGIPVGTENSSVIQSIGTDQYVLPGIPGPAHDCHKFLEVSLLLVLVGTLCIHGMQVLFDVNKVTVFNKLGDVVTQGKRDPLRNLYMIPIDTVNDAQPRVQAPQPGVEALHQALPAMRLFLEPITPI